MVNQQMVPTDATGDGMAWQNLGVYPAGSGDLNVTLGDAANGFVIANAVCLAAVPATTAAPSVVCTGDAAYSESPNSNWQSYADASAYNGDFRYCTPARGRTPPPGPSPTSIPPPNIRSTPPGRRLATAPITRPTRSRTARLRWPP